MSNKLLYTPNKSGGYNILMAYPACEAFALSSLGYMWLYMIADTTEGVSAGRISTDDYNINSGKTDAIAFSMSFDFDYTGVLKILDKLNIPFFAVERNEDYPIVFAGGPVITANPRPYEQFFDFMIIGDGESIFKDCLEILKKKYSKEETLKLLSELDGVYIPGKSAKKRTETLSNIIYTPILSDKSYFKNTFIVELTRGCMNRCSFCTASYTNLPFRSNKYEKIIETIDLGLKNTNKIALLGAQISAHPNFNNIISYIKNSILCSNNIELSVSSLRTDAITKEVIETLVLGGQKHTTIAIEAASERLRKLINKNISEEQILNAIKISKMYGLKGIKIYCMIGLPTETEDDINEFVKLATKIKSMVNGFYVEFSFSTFVPKPHTPFQWTKRECTTSLEKKQNYLEKQLIKLGFSSKFSSAKWDYWQTVLSRSNNDITQMLVDIYKNGGKLGAYKKAAKMLNIDFSEQILGYDIDSEMPWDIISITPGKKFLKDEYERLFSLYGNT